MQPKAVQRKSMSQPAQKRTQAHQIPTVAAPTGCFAVDQRQRGGILLPPSDNDIELVSLEDLGAVMEEIEERLAARPISVGERLLPHAIANSISADRLQTPPSPPLDANPISGLQLRGRDEGHRRDERAWIELQDFSWRPNNPCAASSLVPPAPRPISVAKVAGISASVAALAVIGCAVLLRSVAAEPQTPARQPVSRIVHQPRLPPVRELVASPAPADPAPLEAPANVATQVAIEPVAKRAQAPEAVPDVAAAQPASTGAVELPADDPTAITGLASTPDELTAAEVALPQTPSREQVVAGFEAIQDALMQCAAGRHGVAQIEATVANTGRIAHALIGGDFQGSPEGSCMARVVRTAQLPQFSQPTLKVIYPVSL
jgi:hypothetical protein